MMIQARTSEIVIPSGQALSPGINIEGYELLAIQMPAAWDAANISFRAASTISGVYQDLYNDGGNEVAVAAAANRCIAVAAAAMSLAPLQFIQIRSGSAGTPVNQTASRTLTLILKK
ncbi:MAG: hypothetical protein P4N59_25595 [Negativicutes bacterium]|nr:hypothetical protein [Negativicutes bacterium]